MDLYNVKYSCNIEENSFLVYSDSHIVAGKLVLLSLCGKIKSILYLYSVFVFS